MEKDKGIQQAIQEGEKMKNINVNCPHKDTEHYAKGYCRRCYYLKKRENPAYLEKERKRIRKYSKKWFRAKCKKNPKWNAKRQKDYRKKYPENFNYLMAKFYMKKLTNEKITEMLLEIGYGKENNT